MVVALMLCPGSGTSFPCSRNLGCSSQHFADMVSSWFLPLETPAPNTLYVLFRPKLTDLHQCPFFSFFAVLGLELRAYTLSHSTSHFGGWGFVFENRISWTICLGWLQASIFLISASWVVARITGVSHQRLAPVSFKSLNFSSTRSL
jgi:hypothetical protein